MDIEKIKKYLPYAWIGLPLIGAIIMLILGCLNGHAAVKVMMFVCVALLIILAGLIFFYYYAFGELLDRTKNYFLTNRETGRNVRLADLDFATVNDRMNYFMAKRVSDERELWMGGFLGKRGLFGADDVFKPLAIYKMLFDVAEVNTTENLQMFFDMPDPDFARMINCLEGANDNNMSRKLTSLRRVNDGTQIARLSEFLTANMKYIQGRMLAYIAAHIREFDEPKDRH